MTSAVTYLIDAALGRSAVKFTGKPAPVHMKDPCEFCPNNHTPSGVVLIDTAGGKVFLCQTCAALVNSFDLDGMIEKLRRQITDADGPSPWWLWKKERHRRALCIQVAATRMAHSYFKTMHPALPAPEGRAA